MPLRPSAVAEGELPGVIWRMDDRIRAEATPAEAGTPWTTADVLMGMRYPRQLVTELLQGVHGMRIHGIEESVTYQAIVEEGEIKGTVRKTRRHPSAWPATVRLDEPEHRGGIEA